MTTDFLELHGKAALVVGGGQGMGESVARTLANAGCHVAVFDALADRAARVAEGIRRDGGRAVALSGDVLRSGDIAAAVSDAARQLGRLDILVPIVGIATNKPMLELTEQDWDQQQALHLRYVFLLAQHFARSLIKRTVGGSIVCIGSINGIQAAPNQAAYGAAKAGLIHLVKTMAVEWAPYGIRANIVSPGSIITPRMGDSPERVAALKDSGVPIARLGTAEDVAKAVLFVNSSMASYITGHCLPVDGGWSVANLRFRAPAG